MGNGMQLSKVFGVLILATVAAAVIANLLPDIKRYVRMCTM
jgi:hypothetical protein